MSLYYKGSYMRYFLFTTLFLISANICFGQTNVIKNSNIPSNNIDASSIIKNRVQNDNKINKIDNELNIYRNKSDSFSRQKTYELEKEKINVRSK